jgi:hypothetical protein
VKTVLLIAWPPSSGIETTSSEMTWTAGSAPFASASLAGNGRLEATIRRGGGRADIMRVAVKEFEKSA